MSATIVLSSCIKSLDISRLGPISSGRFPLLLLPTSEL